jgi:hypothetical protein
MPPFAKKTPKKQKGLPRSKKKAPTPTSSGRKPTFEK